MTVLIWLIISGNKEQNINDEIVHTFYSYNFHPPVHQKEQIYLHKDLQTHTMQCFSFSKRLKGRARWYSFLLFSLTFGLLEVDNLNSQVISY